MPKFLKRFFSWLKKLLTQKTLASQVVDNWVTVEYRGTSISFTRAQKLVWDSMTRKQKQATWAANKRAHKKGEVEKAVVNGKTIVIKKK